MKFYKTDSLEPAANFIAKQIENRLKQGEKVLWLVTGGSSIRAAANAGKRIVELDLANLSVTLTDERYVPPDSPDSNWLQLKQAGLNLPGAKLIPVLQDKDRRRTTKDFVKQLTAAIENSDYITGLFGLGEDGHVAGILPGSPAITSKDFALSYSDQQIKVDSPGSVKRGVARITIAPKAIERIDDAVICAFGTSKKYALDQLGKDLKIEQNPAQILKRAGNLVVYNDHIGEKI